MNTKAKETSKKTVEEDEVLKEAAQKKFDETMEKASGTPSKKENKENLVRRDFAEIGSQLYNTDEVEIPAYLRKRIQK